MWAIIKSIFLSLPAVLSLVTKIVDFLEKRKAAKEKKTKDKKKSIVGTFVVELKSCKTDAERKALLEKYTQDDDSNINDV